MRFRRFISIIVSLLILASMMMTSSAAFGAEEDSPERFGTVEYYSTFNPGTTLTDSFYYSDDWFLEDPLVRNDALALVSMQLTASVVEGDENGTGITFLKKLGFEQTGLYGFDEPDPDGCVYAWGTKTIGTGEDAFTLVAVVIQSHSLDRSFKQTGWRQNFLVNGETPTAEHYSYSLAADKVEPGIRALGSGENVKYWIMGQSRGGAIAGVLAAGLKDSASGIFAYTFESPANVESEAVPDNEQDYGYIHNYICSDDLVAMIPPWGMVRYGTEHKLNTAETDEQLSAQLAKLGSAAAESAEYYDGETIENLSSGLINALVEKIPSREEYSTLKTYAFTDEGDQEVNFIYSYQDAFINLMDVVFGDEKENIATDKILEKIDQLIPAVAALRKAVLEGTDDDYHEAAEELCGFLEKTEIKLPISEDVIYIILKIAGTVIIDKDYTPESGEITLEDLMLLIAPVLDLYGNKDYLVFSHQFDTLIARLKVLAEEPAQENLDIMIPEPQAGDDAASTAASAVNAFNEPGYSWLTASAECETDDEILENDRVYYLDVTLSSVGHSIPEDYRIIVNGKEPVKPFEITYADGVASVSGIWALTIGSPQEFSISFDANGHGETPETVYTEAGTKLKYIIDADPGKIVTDSEGTFVFMGWYDENGVSWEEKKADDNITLYASWVSVVDDIEISFKIPRAGEAPEMPEVPEGALYEIRYVSLQDEGWNDIEVPESTELTRLRFEIHPVSKDVEFLTEPDEYDSYEYAGTLLVNGEEADVTYDPDEKIFVIYYTFIPLP